MGFFSAIKTAAVEANEDAHGSRLLTETQTTFACIQWLEAQVGVGVAGGYLHIQSKLTQELVNWSRDGRIKVGREMQLQARKTFDFDLAGSYAKWLAGAWLESRERSGFKAQQAFELLDGLAGVLQQEIQQSSPRDAIQMGFSYNTWEQWLLAFKTSAGRSNPQLKVNGDDKSPIDFMDQSPLRRAYQDKVDPSDLGTQFAKQFDINSFGR